MNYESEMKQKEAFDMFEAEQKKLKEHGKLSRARHTIKHQMTQPLD
jgi:hypothetical protein